MNLSQYRFLIQSLPVKRQCFTTKRSTWKEDKMSHAEWLTTLNNRIFQGEELQLSRDDLFSSQGNIRELIIKTIYWGYPRGMRGRNFEKIVSGISVLEAALKVNSNISTQEYVELVSKVKTEIGGLGPSTLSKILYFSNYRIDGVPCLILDQRLIDVFTCNKFDDLQDLCGIQRINAFEYYPKYIKVFDQLSSTLNVPAENIEQFLFLFGNNLK